MKTKYFVLVVILVLVITLVAVNWNDVQAAVTGKKADGTPAETLADKLKKLTGSTTVSSPIATNGNTAGSTILGTPDYNKVLQRGVKGSEVTMLQNMLNTINASLKRVSKQLVVDGDFGSKTEAMLKAYNNNVSSITLNDAISKYQNAAGV